METFIILPDGTLERDVDGLIPANCPLDPILWGVNLTDHQYEDTCSLEYDQVIRYIRMRDEGQSHNIAMVLATRSFPGVKTDAIFNEGRCNGNQFEKTPAQGDYLRRIAEAHGVSTTGKQYMKGLARFPGDPMAWVNGRHDVARVAEAHGMNVHGYVEHRSHDREPMQDIPIDPKLVRAEALDILESHPGAKYRDVYEQVEEFRTGKVDPNPLLVEG